jgi:hypothetical protein
MNQAILSQAAQASQGISVGIGGSTGGLVGPSLSDSNYQNCINWYPPWGQYYVYATLDQIREVVRDEIRKALNSPDTSKLKKQLRDLADKL